MMIFVRAFTLGTLLFYYNCERIQEVMACWAKNNQFYFSWSVAEQDNTMEYWNTLSVTMDDQNILKIAEFKIYTFSNDCADVVFIEDFNVYRLLNVKTSCFSKIIILTFEDFRKKMSAFQIIPNQKNKCQFTIIPDLWKTMCLVFPHTLAAGTHYSKRYDCPLYINRKVFYDSKSYTLVEREEITVDELSIRISSESFDIIQAKIENSNIKIVIEGSFETVFEISSKERGVLARKKLKFEIFTVQIYFLPLVTNLLKFINSKPMEKYMLDEYILNFKVEKDAKISKINVYCVIDWTTQAVDAMLTIKKQTYHFHLRELSKCCHHFLKVSTRVIYNKVETSNEYSFNLLCLMSSSNYFMNYVSVEVYRHFEELFSHIKISFVHEEYVMNIRINISSVGKNEESILCDIPKRVCSNKLFHVIFENVIHGEVELLPVQQYFYIEGSFDQVYFYRHPRIYEVEGTNPFEPVKKTEELFNFYVFNGVQSLEWSFLKYTKLIKSYKLLISWNEMSSILVGICYSNQSCEIKSTNIKDLEFTRMKLIHDQIFLSPNGHIKLSFEIHFNDETIMPSTMKHIYYRYNVFLIPQLIIVSKLVDGRSLYVVKVIENKYVKVITSSSVHFEGISVEFGTNLTLMKWNSGIYVESDRTKLKLIKLKRNMFHKKVYFKVGHHILTQKIKWKVNKKYMNEIELDICHKKS